MDESAKTAGDTFRVLLIEADADDADFIRAALADVAEPAFAVEQVESFAAAMEKLAKGEFEALLLTARPAGRDLLEALSELCSAAPHAPVVVMAKPEDEQLGMEAIRAGAQDCVVNAQMNGPLLSRCLQNAVARHRRGMAPDQAAPGLTGIDNEFKRYPQRVFEKNRDLVFTYANEAFASILGLRPEDLIGKTDLDAFPEQHAREYRAEDERIMRARKPYRTSYATFDDDGACHQMEMRKTFTSDEAGQVTGLRFSVTDITPDSRSVNALFQWGTTIIPYGYAMIGVTADGKVFLWTPGAERLYGYSAEEVMERPIAELAAPGEKEQLERLVKTTTLGGASQHCEMKHLTKEGRPVYVSISTRRIQGKGFRVCAISMLVHDITARRQAEEALRGSEKQLRAILESSRDTIYQLNLETGAYDYVSPSSELALGLTPDKLTGMSREEQLEHVHLDDREMVAADFENMRAEAGDWRRRIEYRFWHEVANKYVWASDNRTLVPGDEGRASVVVGTIRNVTARAIAEQLRERIGASLKFATDKLPERIFLKDRDLTFVFANDAFARTLGTTPKGIVGKTDFDFFPADSAQGAQAQDRRVIQSGKTEIVLFEVTDGDGQVHTMESFKNPTVDKTGRVTGVLRVARDVTAEQEAQGAASQWIAVILSSRDAIMGLSVDGRILVWNPAAEKLYGYSAEEAQRRTLASLAPSEARQELQQMVKRAAQGETIRNYDCRQESQAGEDITVSLTLSPILGTEGEVDGISVVGRDVSARKRAEEALRQKGAAPGTGDPEQPRHAIIKNRDLAFVWADEAFAAAHEMSPAEIAGKTDFDLFPPEQARQFRAEDRQIIESGEPGVLLNPKPQPDGRVEYWEHLKFPMFGPDGEVEEVLTVSTEVTARRMTEITLSQWAAVATSSDDAIMGVALDGSILSWNPGAESLYGHSRAEAEGQPMAILAPPEGRQQLAQMLERVGRGESVRDYEVTHVDKDSRRVPVALTLSPIIGRDGEVAAISAIARDVTARKLAEDAMRASEELLRNMMQSSRDVVYRLNLGTDTYDYVSPSVQDLTGFTVDETSNMSPEERHARVHPEDREGFLAAEDTLSQSADDLPEPIVEYRYRHKNGNYIWISDSRRLVSNPQGQPTAIVGTSRNITKQKRAEQQLQRTIAELARSNAELEQFAYVASHDLQEPLRMVASYVQLLARRYEGRLDVDADEFIGYAVDGASRMQTLINDLLAFSRVSSRPRRPALIECNEILEEAEANLEASIQETGAEVSHEELPTVTADRSQLVQLFQNLIGNALKFHGKAAPRVHVSVEEKDAHWVFSVRDNGIGMDPQFLDRIFTIFQRLHTRDEYPGTGIGLAVCKRIVEGHGGRIWAESQPGQGAIFRFSLPLSASEHS